MKIPSLIKPAILIFILLFLGWRLAEPVDILGSDLGRHIKNGELILHGYKDVLYKNFYSYTNPEYPFVNSHWLFGVWAYLLWHFFGFSGLDLVYVLLEVLTFYVFFRIAERYSSFLIACTFGLLSFPLICSRNEVRPEGISYLFCGLYWLFIDAYQSKQLKFGPLAFFLCVLQIIWVNVHIYFVFGPFLTALFCFQAFCLGDRQQAGDLLKLFALLAGVSLINPSGFNGLLNPFTIDKSYYAYPTQENYSVFTFLKTKGSLVYFLATVGVLIAPFCFLLQRKDRKNYIFAGVLSIILSMMAIKAMRMIGLFGYFWLPLASLLYYQWLQVEGGKISKNIVVVLLISGMVVSVSEDFDWKQPHFLGIVPHSNDAAEFYKREKIHGPIFNNADVGNYLIFHLAPREKVFIDMRIQPYPGDFLKQFIQMQSDDGLWHRMERKYHFNAIILKPEQSLWGIKFFVTRLKDPSWSLVFLGQETMIFLKRNAVNADIIKRDEVRNTTINIPDVFASI